MTRIEKLRKSNVAPKRVVWVLWAALLVIAICLVWNWIASGTLEQRGVSAFIVLLLAYYITTQQQLNKELLGEIDVLKKELRKIKNPQQEITDDTL